MRRINGRNLRGDNGRSLRWHCTRTIARTGAGILSWTAGGYRTGNNTRGQSRPSRRMITRKASRWGAWAFRRTLGRGQGWAHRWDSRRSTRRDNSRYRCGQTRRRPAWIISRDIGGQRGRMYRRRQTWYHRRPIRRSHRSRYRRKNTRYTTRTTRRDDRGCT